MIHRILGKLDVEAFEIGAPEMALLGVGVLITLALAVAFVVIMIRRDAAGSETGSDGEGP